MPIFEYTCNTCKTGRKFSALVGVVAGASAPKCPRCGGEDLTKLISRFARLRSDDEKIDALAEEADGMDMDDPRAVRRLAREMAGEMEADVPGEAFEEMLEEEISGGGGSDSDF